MYSMYSFLSSSLQSGGRGLFKGNKPSVTQVTFCVSKVKAGAILCSFSQSIEQENGAKSLAVNTPTC